MDWTHKVLKRAERWLGHPTSPLPVKELAWRVINWVIKCGASNPISFALRPIAMSSKLRMAVGINLAVLAVSIGFLGPLPTMADNSGGQLSLITLQPEISLSTPTAVQLPLVSFYVSQGFWTWHSGVDMATDSGEPIRPIMTGVVTKVEKNWFGYGNMVIVKHNHEYESLYAHMSKILVTEGQEVFFDTVLGLVGTTGRSTGPHLHLEIYENGKIINPAPILGFETK
jgi:murein DD-endopeptidase MepM/ murein hydrolase activator NlpD